jgi:dTDP-4-dehydrorhamnose reductase
MKKILLLGSSGLFGSYTYRALHAVGTYEVTTVRNRSGDAGAPRDTSRRLDLSDDHHTALLLEQVQPDVVINCAAIGDVDRVNRAPDLARPLNVGLPMLLADRARALGYHFIHLSTNAVYDGSTAPYAEGAPHHPLHSYGAMKSEVDHFLRNHTAAVTIVRPTVGYGWHEPDGRRNPLTAVLRTLESAGTVMQVTDQFENPVYAGDVAETIVRIVAHRVRGEFNVGGADRHLSRYAWFTRVAEVFGHSAQQIVPATMADFPSHVLRPRDTTFDCSRLVRELGVVPVSVTSGAHQMRSESERWTTTS